MSAESYDQWRAGVLQGVRAPQSAQNDALLDGWAEAETSPYPLMRWANPLNCTEKMAGSRDSGAQPGANDVQIYADVASGISATVATLLNGRYPAIVAGLRASKPPKWYQDTASAEFGVWGTGAAFLAHVPTVEPNPPAPPTRRIPEMWLYQGASGTIYQVSGSVAIPLHDIAEVNYLESKGAPLVLAAELTPETNAEYYSKLGMH